MRNFHMFLRKTEVETTMIQRGLPLIEGT